jgi:hypothetical protein
MKNNKSRTIIVRITEEQGKKLDRDCEKKNMTVSEWVRDRIERIRK